jgi:predicted CoA-binding protein
MQEIFDTYKNIAVVGMSTNPGKAAYGVPSYIAGQGFNIIPVNPMAEEIIGKKSYPTLMDIPDTIDIVNVFRPSDAALDVVKSAIERKQAKGDVKLIWLQEGIINETAKNLAEENGIEFIQDKCMYKEYVNM